MIDSQQGRTKNDKIGDIQIDRLSVAIHKALLQQLANCYERKGLMTSALKVLKCNEEFLDFWELRK